MNHAQLPDPVPQVFAVGRHHFPSRTNEIQRLPWLYATQTLDGSGPNQRGKYKSAYMREPFPRHQIDTMWKFLSDDFDNPQALLQVDSYGCRINAVPSDATAVPQRSSILKLQYQTYWTTEAETEKNLRWINDFYVAMYGPDGPRPDATMDGCYVNYPDVDLKDGAVSLLSRQLPAPTEGESGVGSAQRVSSRAVGETTVATRHGSSGNPSPTKSNVESG